MQQPAKSKSMYCFSCLKLPWYLYAYFTADRESESEAARGKSRPMKARCPTKRKSHPCMCKCYVLLWVLWLPTIKFALQSSEKHERRGLEAALPEGVPFHLQIQNQRGASLQLHKRECNNQLEVSGNYCEILCNALVV